MILVECRLVEAQEQNLKEAGFRDNNWNVINADFLSLDTKLSFTGTAPYSMPQSAFLQ